MPNPDLWIYVFHTGSMGAFVATRLILSLLDRGAAAAAATPVVQEEKTAPFSRALLIFHALGFFVVYLGLGRAVKPNRVPNWFPGQRIVGAAVIVGGAALACWALASFRSWRIRAQLEKGHELATGGPYRFLRHPIYMGINLYGLGSAIWVPTPTVWIGFVLMAIGSDLRGRAEEKLLAHAFGATYLDYCSRTSRFIPGIY